MTMERTFITTLSEDDLHTIIRKSVVEGLKYHAAQGETVSIKDEPDQYLNPKEAAKLVRACAATLRSWEAKGTIKAKRVGRKVYYSKKMLLSVLENEKGKSKPTSYSK